MSFARVGRPTHGKGKRIVRIKKAPAPKKEWVVSFEFSCLGKPLVH